MGFFFFLFHWISLSYQIAIIFHAITLHAVKEHHYMTAVYYAIIASTPLDTLFKILLKFSTKWTHTHPLEWRSLFAVIITVSIWVDDENDSWVNTGAERESECALCYCKSSNALLFTAISMGFENGGCLGILSYSRGGQTVMRFRGC